MAEIKSHRTTCLTDEWDIAQQPFNQHSKTHPNYFIAKIPLRIPGTYLLHSKKCIIMAHKILFLPLCFSRRSCNKSQSFSVFCKTGKRKCRVSPVAQRLWPSVVWWLSPFCACPLHKLYLKLLLTDIRYVVYMSCVCVCVFPQVEIYRSLYYTKCATRPEPLLAEGLLFTTQLMYPHGESKCVWRC